MWRPLGQWSHGAVPAYVLPWLRDAASLTRRLQRGGCGPFRVEVRAQAWQRPQTNESALLRLRRGERTLVREVSLYTGETMRVYARTVMPARTIRRRGRLARVGQRSLGATLFSDRSLRRGERQVARIDASHSLFSAAVAALPAAPGAIWGRRSTFLVRGAPLLVTEFFLPTIADCRSPR